MADPEASFIRRLEETDLPFAQEIREIAGWNQTDRDWLRLLAAEPEGCFLIESEGRPAGTATTTTYGNEVGWIGMVLVHPDCRRRGLATRLLEHCIDYLRPRTECVKLDATSAGAKVYESLGFAAESEVHRWEGIIPGDESAGTIMKDSIDIPDLLALDREAFGADRASYLHRLADDSAIVKTNGTAGFAMVRPGLRASYFGPAVAESPSAGEQLARSVLESSPGVPLFWDIPAENTAAVRLSEQLGFTRQRSLLRMRLGNPGFEGDLAHQWAIGAPETG